jgi:16S rRNA C1402 (ribose-2'-O) methylase RsmI
MKSGLAAQKFIFKGQESLKKGKKNRRKNIVK